MYIRPQSSVERYRRQEEDHSNRKTVDSWEEVKRLKQTSLMDKAKDLEDLDYDNQWLKFKAMHY